MWNKWKTIKNSNSSKTDKDFVKHKMLYKLLYLCFTQSWTLIFITKFPKMIDDWW